MQKVKSSLEEKPDEYVGLLAALNNTSLNRPPQAFSGLCSSLSFSSALKALLGPTRPPLYQPAPWQGSLGRCGTCPGHLETQTEHLHERRR